MHKPALVLIAAVTAATFGLQGQPNTHTDTQGVKLIPNVAQVKTLDQVPEQQSTAITASYTAPVAPAPVQRVEPVAAAPVVVSDNDGMAFIFAHESSNRPNAVNEIGACGLGQALPCSKLANVCPNWRTDIACQRSFFTDYANQRYGGWSQAKAFWQSHRWW